MTPSERAIIEAMILGNWPRTAPDDDTLSLWMAQIDDLPPAQIEAAVEAIARSGEQWPPNGGMIRREVAELALDAPQWGEVRRQLGACFSKPENLWSNGSLSFPRQERLERCHPAIRALVESLGWGEVARCLGAENDTAGESQLRDKYRDHIRTLVRDETLRGLRPAGLPALERANRVRPIGELMAGALESVRPIGQDRQLLQPDQQEGPNQDA